MARAAASRRSGKILAYFSHSYREADQQVNSFFWRLFSDEGFFFTVDPQSQLFSIPYLESMMTLSNCFVAVITKRPGTPAGCSPYILFEYGLSIQAQKPTLVFVEQGLSGEAFPRDADRIVTFNRQRLANQQDEFTAAIKKLAEKVRGFRNPDLRLQQPGGLILHTAGDGAGIYTPAVVDSLRTAMVKHGRQLDVVKSGFDVSFEFCLELEKYDFLLMETRDSLQAPWLAGYVLGRAVPCIKVCHLAAGETPDAVPLSPIVARHKPEHTDEAPVAYWRDTTELVAGVMTHVSKFGTERIEFHSKSDGLRYFQRAGRRDAKVFVSNAGGSNPLAHKLIARLRLESVDFFHYQVKDAIPVGERWVAELERQIELSGVFVALLSEEYLQSPWCMFELQAARRRLGEGSLKLHPYLLQPLPWGHMTLLGIGDIQARDLSAIDERAMVAEIVRNVDKELKASSAGSQPVRPPSAGSAPATPAALVLTEGERAALVDAIAARLTPEDAAGRPSWIKGLLMQAWLYAPLAGEDYSGSARAAATTLVTKAEALGVLPDGRRGVLQLVRALRDHGRISQEAVPLLNEVAQRLEGAART